MITETGRVVAIEADGLWVETLRRSTCGSCSARAGCGHGLLNRIAEGRRGYIRVLPGATECRIDDQVLIAIPEDVILRGSMVVYLVPLLATLMLAGGATWLWPQAGDAAALAGAALGFALGVVLVRCHAWRHRADPQLQPTMVEVLAPGAQALAVT